MANDDWKDDVRNKLISIFESNEEGLLRILWLLDDEDRAYKEANNDMVSPMWRTLRSALVSDKIFQKYAEKMIVDAKSAENDPRFRSIMRMIYEKMMEAGDQELPKDGTYDLARIGDEKLALSGFSSGLSRAWSLISSASKTEVLALLQKLAQNNPALSAVDEIVGLANKAGGNAVMIGLAAVALTYQCYVNIKRWMSGEITGKRCAKNCLDSLASIGAGVGGGLMGTAVGTLVMPGLGSVLGGILGGVFGAQITNVLSDKLTRHLFDLPKEEAAEKAYNYLGVSHRAPNDEINKIFRAKCLEYHPDKGGNAEDFIQLQFYMAVIKTSRGEFV